MKIKKWKTLIIILLGVFSFSLIASIAAVEISKINHKEDTRATMGEAITGLDGLGTADNPYLITSDDDFYRWSTQTGWTQGHLMGHVKLMNDIKVTRSENSKFSNAAYVMWGFTFNGNFKEIEVDINVALPSNNTNQPVALFPNVSNCTIKNLKVVGSVTESGNAYAVGGLIGNVGGSGATIDNCYVDVNIIRTANVSDTSKRYYVGGIVGCAGFGSGSYGDSQLTIKNSCFVGSITCTNYNSTVIKADGHYYGGKHHRESGMTVNSTDNCYYDYEFTKGSNTEIKAGAKSIIKDFDTAYRSYREGKNYFVDGDWANILEHAYEHDYWEYDENWNDISKYDYAHPPTISFLINDGLEEDLYEVVISVTPSSLGNVVGTSTYYVIGDQHIKDLYELGTKNIILYLNNFGKTITKNVALSLKERVAVAYVNDYRDGKQYSIEINLAQTLLVHIGDAYFNGSKITEENVVSITNALSSEAVYLGVKARLNKTTGNYELEILDANVMTTLNTVMVDILNDKYYLIGWYVDSYSNSNTNYISSMAGYKFLNDYDINKDADITLYPVLGLKSYNVEGK